MKRSLWQIIRKKLFGGLSDAELTQEHKNWRKKVHDSRAPMQNAYGEAYRQTKKSKELFDIAEETAKILEKGIEEQKRIRIGKEDAAADAAEVKRLSQDRK